MADVIKGANFFIVPEIDRQSATQAEAAIQKLVRDSVKAVEDGNESLLRKLNAQTARAIGKKPEEIKVDVKYETNSATGQFKEIKKLSANALDPLIADYKKMEQIQGKAALKTKQTLNVMRDQLAVAKNQALTLNKKSRAYARNLQAQKALNESIRKQETILRRVTTLASAKGQLRAESQKLSMMAQYTSGLDKQGRIVTRVNQEWLRQRELVRSLSGQVNAAGAAAQGFGARVSAAGQSMQAAFGWIAAVVAGLTAVAGSISMITGRVKDIQSIKLTFEGMGQSIEAQNDILASAKNIALGYGVSLRKVEGAFRRLGPAILESGGTLKDTETAIKSIAARTTMLGLNTEQAGRYIEAFAQVMGKGKLQSEELNQQFSELDGGLRGQLKNWLAANKGITDFENAMKNGEITSGLFLEAFEAINEEVRTKFLRSIGDTQKGIEEMGQKGGMTLNQLNAKLQTLTSVGLESVGQALAPLGKELMKIYAAFVQVFTKIAAEMPGVQKLFQGLGYILGGTLKLAINSIILAFGYLMKVIDVVVNLAIKLYDVLKKIPGVGALLGGMETYFTGMINALDEGVDSFSKLSDETIGAKSELEKYNDEMKNLTERFNKEEISAEEYYKKKEELMLKSLESERQAAEKSMEIEQNKLDELLKIRKGYLDRKQQLADREISDIEKTRDLEIDGVDKNIKALEKQKDATAKMYDSKIEQTKRAYEMSKRAIEDEMALLKRQKDAVKDHYSEKLSSVKDYYDTLQSQMKEAHAVEMANIDAKIAALREAQSQEMDALKTGPQQAKLNQMKMLDLKKRIAAEDDAMKRQSMRAELERMQNSKKRADLEKKHIAEMKKAEEEKAAAEKRQAEEKKKLEEEERARVKKIESDRQQALDDIKAAVEKLAGIKREDARNEKDEIRVLKDAKKDAMDEYKKQLEEEKQIKKEIQEQALEDINKIKEALNKERQAVEDIEYEMKDVQAAQSAVARSVDATTNGALERQLRKVQAIRAEMDKIAAKKASTTGASSAMKTSGTAQFNARLPFRASGGPVSGGSSYTVNELGKEGFLSASGRVSEIKAPAWGEWRAPSSGTVIPAHIWKGIKEGQKASITMPRDMNPGNGVARAISTISSVTGDTISNNVTIQSNNPAQTANNMMVEMTRLKRRRLG